MRKSRTTVCCSIRTEHRAFGASVLLPFRAGDIMHLSGNLPEAHKEDTWS